MSSDRPNPPGGLSAPGRALWRRMHAALASDLRFSASECEVLARACVAADREAVLRAAVRASSVPADGPMPSAWRELRLIEAEIVGLLQRLSFTETPEQLTSPKTRRARAAASSRWMHHDEVKAARDG